MSPRLMGVFGNLPPLLLLKISIAAISLIQTNENGCVQEPADDHNFPPDNSAFGKRKQSSTYGTECHKASMPPSDLG